MPSPDAASIRPAEPHDAPAIARLHIRTWQVAYRGQLPDGFLDALDSEVEERTSRWRRSIADARARGRVQLVVEDDDHIIGFVTFGPAEETDDAGMGEVYAIYVDPTYWDRGYGRALFTAAMRGLEEAGFRGATLWVLETNARARRFYEVAGWIADGATKTDHRGDIELREVRYRRALTPGAR